AAWPDGGARVHHRDAPAGPAEATAGGLRGRPRTSGPSTGRLHLVHLPREPRPDAARRRGKGAIAPCGTLVAMVKGPAFVDTSLGRGLAVAAGVSFAAFPTVGPLIALLAVSTGRIEVQRADRWWWAAGLALSTPFLFTGSPRAAL